MAGKTYIGNSSDLSVELPSILIGDDNGLSKDVQKIYVGDGNNRSVKVWPSPLLPFAYQQVEYIQNADDKSYIWTGIHKVDNYLTFYIDFSILSYRSAYAEGNYDNNNGMIGLRKTRNSYTQYCYGLKTLRSNQIIICVPDEYDTPETRGEDYKKYYKIIKTVNYNYGERHTILFNATGGYFYYDNNLVGQTYNTYTWSGQYVDLPLFWFGVSTNSSSSASWTDYAPQMNLYGFKAWDNDVLIRDMIPCYRKSDNVIGMYDLVNDQFYTNAGTGIFYKGPNV